VRIPFVVLLLLVLTVPASADPLLSALVEAYPDHLSGYDDNAIIFKNGARMPVSDGIPHKSFEQLLGRPSIRDQFALPYPLGGNIRPPARNEDPGRFRNEAFFTAIYGDCRKGEVTPQLRRIAWLPRHGGGTVMVTTVNGVAEKLAAISRELDASPDLAKYAAGSAGAYSCRSIAGTRRPSFHGYGAAIDLNPRFSDYWLWKANAGSPVWRNRIPPAIVEIFERHGFIWGGKWYHYDTMHFEYRPELIAAAKMR
jgi:D-alanyl-D-alanine carboxypeptidase